MGPVTVVPFTSAIVLAAISTSAYGQKAPPFGTISKKTRPARISSGRKRRSCPGTRNRAGVYAR